MSLDKILYKILYIQTYLQKRTTIVSVQYTVYIFIHYVFLEL